MLPRLTYIVLLLLLLQHAGFAQKQTQNPFKTYREIDSLTNWRPWNRLPLDRKNLFATRPGIVDRDVFTKPVIRRRDNKPVEIKSMRIDRNTNVHCTDTSVRLVYRKDPDFCYNEFITKTRDGNILMPGADYYSSTHQTLGSLLKVTQQGDTIWTRKIVGGFPGQYSQYFLIYKAFELADQSLLLAGEMFVPMPYNGRYDPVLIRTTSDGQLIWEKAFKSRVWDVDTTMGSVDFIDCKQDASGNLYLAGDIRNDALPRVGLAAKMDINGNVLWSKGIYTNSFPKITGVNITANRVTFLGRTVSSYYNDVLNFGIVADASTGDTLLSTCFQSPTNDFWHTFYGENMVKLNNGNLVLYGRGVSDGSTFDPTHVPTHAGLIEFTPDLQFVQSYILKSPTVGNVDNTRITVFADGSAAFTWLKYISGYNADITFGSFRNGQILKERVIPYRGLGLPWVSNFLQMDDGGQIVGNTIGDSLANANYIEFMRLHNSDTAGSCLGKDTVNTLIEKQYYHNANIYIDSVLNDVLTEEQRPFDGIYNNSFVIQSGCKPASFCDSLHLVSSRDTVCENVPVNITVQKNKECGAYPFWNYDSSAVSSFYQLNDSTVQVTFNKPWQGFIHSSIEGCKTLEDSVNLTVLVAPAKLDIGPDTSICPGNTIVLNAKTGYSSYRWQDGSADSIFTVTKPGTYYVTTKDACGEIFSDTVTVVSHPPIPFDAGPDISICENDTATITAPPGFLHYQWTSYNISADTDRVVKVFPAMSFMYKVIAEKTPGCFASDSLLVTVNQVPAINLGNDTSFCMNQSVVLDAGSGFDRYEWNTGEMTEKIVVKQQGSFAVKATLNGCSAYDTMKVVNVYPLPSFSLGNDTALCEGQQLQYNFNLPNALYTWSTGNTLNTQIINQSGTYWLQVTQTGCANTDTIEVQYTPSPFVALGNDTTICEKQTLQLDAFNNNAVYLWQDGSKASGYLVKSAGTYFVTVDLNNCTVSDTINILYKAAPFFTLGKDSFLCSGQQYVLKPLINTNASLLWQDGSSAPSFTVVKDGIYFLTATDECGSYTDSVTITTGICDIMMPSAFTPNSDGLNDVFRVKYPFPVKQFNMDIYDRFGEKVFETNDISKGWDGTWKGVPNLQGTYVWVISFIDINNKQQQLKGLVTLLR